MIEHQWLHEVEWGECDPAGIVFYPNFYRWFDASCHQLMNHHGFGQSEMIARFGIVGFALIEAHAEFINPVCWQEKVAVRSQVHKHSDKTFTIQHRIYVVNDADRLCVNGYEVRIWGVKDEATGVMKAWNLPDAFIRGISGPLI